MISNQSLIRTNSNSAVQSFESVQQSHLNRMVDILGETYEAVWWVLGSDLFRSLCQDYIESQTSGPYSLNEFGSNMSEFIATQANSYDIPFLADLARFEWIYKGIQITDTPRPLSPAMLRELVSAKDYRVQFVNALEIYTSEFAISEIWRHRKGPTYKFEEINWGVPENLLVYKRDGVVQVHKISALDAQILGDLADGQSVTATFGRSSEALDAFKVQELLEMMTQSGIIEDILVYDT
jgi:Uncharacterized protein conserved in bacteria (DUF2063).